VLHAATPVAARRQALREGLASGRLLRFPGAFNALSALLIAELGFEGVYVSGAVVSASLGLPDVELTTLAEVARWGQEIARMVSLPTLVDADTGFGGRLNAARTIQVLEDTGAAGCHLEDQVSPKRCGHLEGKRVVPTEEMVARIGAAVRARRDPDFVICARTDARAVEGLGAAIERARAYVDAGADMVFPEALAGAAELERFRAAIPVPLLANMTEFGRSDLLDTRTLAGIGINLVIYPVTLLRLAMGAAERGLRALLEEGTQSRMVAEMQTRARLYELLDYDTYTAFEDSLVPPPIEQGD
jgi:methylisocitrate lyase